ncbi:MAG: hypothetical protein AB7L17_15900 [Ilumatobacteraceae bacterium]
MTRHHVEAIIHETPEDVSALLAHRPSSWLRAFLVLAVRPSGGGPSSRATRPLYRIGLPEEEAGSSVVRAPFVWWPHSDRDVFERFRGSFRVAPRQTGCELDLDGEASGGRPERNDEVLHHLVELIGGAIEADQASPA